MITNLYSQPGSTQLIIQISQIWQWLTTRCQIISAGQIHFLSAAVLLCCTKKSALCTRGKGVQPPSYKAMYLLQGHLNSCWMEGPNLFTYSTASLNSRTLNSGWGSTIIRKEQPFVFLLHGQLTVDVKMIFGIKNNLTTMMRLSAALCLNIPDANQHFQAFTWWLLLISMFYHVYRKETIILQVLWHITIWHENDAIIRNPTRSTFNVILGLWDGHF